MHYLTRTEALREHWKMWDWLAENPGMDKMDYFFEMIKLSHSDRPIHLCFACEYAMQQSGTDSWDNASCRFCPVKWPSTASDNPCLFSSEANFALSCMDEDAENGLYSFWKSEYLDYYGFSCADDLARQIRDLPERRV